MQPPVHDYAPKFVFVVATKRHHRRLWEKKTRYVREREREREKLLSQGKETVDNAPAMTAVDTTIVHPTLFEFFLQTHTPLQVGIGGVQAER